jgi:copper chaperone
MESITIKVGGMTCMGCVGSVTRVLQAVDGVAKVDVSLEKAQANIEYDPQRVSLDALRAAVEDAGYDAAL